MKVIEKARELKANGIIDLWIMQEGGYENCYGLYGYSSIENTDYIEMNKDVFNSEVKECQIIPNNIARIIY